MNIIKTLKLLGLFVSFACAANNDAAFPPLTDSHLLTAGTDEQLTAEEIFQIVFKPLPPGIRFSNYDFHSDFPLPYEIWLEVFSHTDPMAIWNFGLTCKWAAALIRDNKIRLDLIWAVPENMGHLLLNGELRLHNWAANILEPMLRSWAIFNVEALVGMVYPEHPNAPFAPEQKELLYQKWYQLCSRSADLKIAQLAFRVFNLDSFHLSCLIPTCDHMYVNVNAFSTLFYLPPNDGVPLLQRIDPRLIAVMVWSNYSYHPNKKFTIPLLLEYVIPSFQNWNRINAVERGMLCFILPQQYAGLMDYMKYLLWAIYLHTGTLRKNEKTVIRHVVNHFESFNLEWKRLCGGQSAAKKFESQKSGLNEHQFKAIYIVAKQWKLDLIKIARNSSWFPMSQQILAGVFPDFLTDNAPSLSCLDLYKVIYRAEPSKLKIEGSSIIYEEIDEPNKKRAGEDLAVEEPAAKKQRFGEAPTQDSVETSIMTQSNQVQLGVNTDTQLHPSSLVIDSSVSDEQLVEEIMSKIAWLRQIIPDSIAQMNQQGPVDMGYFIQTLNNLESIVQNTLPQLNFCQPQPLLQYQCPYDQFYVPNSIQAPAYQQFQHVPVYPQAQQMQQYQQVQQMNAYIPQVQQIQTHALPNQQQAAHQPNLPQTF